MSSIDNIVKPKKILGVALATGTIAAAAHYYMTDPETTTDMTKTLAAGYLGTIAGAIGCLIKSYVNCSGVNKYLKK